MRVDGKESREGGSEGEFGRSGTDPGIRGIAMMYVVCCMLYVVCMLKGRVIINQISQGERLYKSATQGYYSNIKLN